jgi:hypothetical protein
MGVRAQVPAIGTLPAWTSVKWTVSHGPGQGHAIRGKSVEDGVISGSPMSTDRGLAPSPIDVQIARDHYGFLIAILEQCREITDGAVQSGLAEEIARVAIPDPVEADQCQVSVAIRVKRFCDCHLTGM